MAHRHPCYRHPRGVWMAACPDCTAWYRAARPGREGAPAIVDPTPLLGESAREDGRAAA